jgi:hypothetical protein
MRRHACALIALFALGLVLSGCGGSESATDTESATTAETTTAETTTAATTTAATTTTQATTAATTTTAPQPTVVTIRVVDGKPEGGIARPSVDQGDRVVLVVHSDTAEEVHLHGYDLSQDVAAGGTARIPFTADLRGRFEIELENSGVQIAELTVN